MGQTKSATNRPTASINAEDYLKREPSSFKFTETKPSRVLKLQSKLDVAKGTVLDQICNKILSLLLQFSYLFNLSLKILEFPDDWKLGNVFPFFKVGERKNPNNHRPVSVLLTVSRAFEKLVYVQVYHYLVINNILDPLNMASDPFSQLSNPPS